MPNTVNTVACVGGGVIGAAWAARFALFGKTVVVADPSPQAQQDVDNALCAARRAWRKLTLAPMPSEGPVRITADIAEAASSADYIQESVPEREDLKREILAALESTCASTTVIASSTSGLLPSRLQAGMRHPERFCVAHPFNPVYLLPLVEICGGRQTSAETTQQVATVCRELGMHPLMLSAEIDGFVADRLMEALWREALWLVNDNIATTAEIDDAIRFGCGLRWAFMGPFLTYRLAGGAGGMRHFMAQFGPALKLPWTKLMDTPELNDSLLDKIVAQSDAQTGGLALPELMHKRDDCLIAIMQGLRGEQFAAGEILRQHEAGIYAQTHAAKVNGASEIPTPLVLYQTRVAAEWIDYNHHMTESRYLQAFGDATDAFLHYIGVDDDYVAVGQSYYTVETHLRHLAQAYAGDLLVIQTQVVAADDKRVHLFHTMKRDDIVVATAEHMLLHVRGDRAAVAAQAVNSRVQRITAAHQSLPLPEGAGRAIAIR